MSDGRDPKKEKELDYANERRSRAWSSDKGDRKKRPLAKAMEHRAERRTAHQALGIDPGPLPPEDAEALELELLKQNPKRHALEPVSKPLGERVQEQLDRRRKLDRQDEAGDD